MQSRSGLLAGQHKEGKIISILVCSLSFQKRLIKCKYEVSSGWRKNTWSPATIPGFAWLCRGTNSSSVQLLLCKPRVIQEKSHCFYLRQQKDKPGWATRVSNDWTKLLAPQLCFKRIIPGKLQVCLTSFSITVLPLDQNTVSVLS